MDLRAQANRAGDELVPFSTTRLERFYKIIKNEAPDSVHLELVTEMKRSYPQNMCTYYGLY